MCPHQWGQDKADRTQGDPAEQRIAGITDQLNLSSISLPFRNISPRPHASLSYAISGSAVPAAALFRAVYYGKYVSI